MLGKALGQALDKGITRMPVSILAATLGSTLILVMPSSSGLTYHSNIHRSGGVGEGGCLHLLLKIERHKFPHTSLKE
jgi:hypothetical protein